MTSHNCLQSMENELVYDLNVFDLIQRDERWQKVWDYFVASCYPKSDLKPRINIDEFRRVKHGSPNRWRDNWLEFKKKVTRCELLDHLDRTKSRRHWNVSDGKLSRSTNLDENLYLSMTVLGEILGENLQQQRRGVYDGSVYCCVERIFNVINLETCCRKFSLPTHGLP